jgi:general transcription factor 3C polypeptide 5 (transcription factor C subunit 1)
MLDSGHPDEVVPIYLRPNDPMCAPLLSNAAHSNNLLLKVMVPKRTGRKRKRGTLGPFLEPNEINPTRPASAGSEKEATEKHDTQSHSRLDPQRKVLKILKDNVGKYKIDVIGEIKQTHRFRGLADFQQSTANSQFFSRFQDKVLTGDLDKMKDFTFDGQMGWKPQEDLLPPPTMATHSLPFNWAYYQNPNIYEEVDPVTGERVLTNLSKVPRVKVKYLSQHTEKIPVRGPDYPEGNGPLLSLIQMLREALDERPMWTRRSLNNRIANHDSHWLFKQAVQYVGYQFKGGPFRDAIIRFGVDPRKDRKYRIYQTLFFKLYEEEEKEQGQLWHDVRTNFATYRHSGKKEDTNSHIFDGKSLTIDGKIWQVCDIVDPILRKVLQDAPYPEKFDPKYYGWYNNGTIAKVKAIMKVKLIAIRIGRHLDPSIFADAIKVPDYVPETKSKSIKVPVPDIRLTEEEVEKVKRGNTGAALQSGVYTKAGMYGNRRKRIMQFDPSMFPGRDVDRPYRSRRGGSEEDELEGGGSEGRESESDPEEVDDDGVDDEEREMYDSDGDEY